MAKRRYKKARRSGKKKLPLAVAGGVALPMYNYIGEPILHGDTARAMRQANYYAFGRQEDGSGFQLAGPMMFYGPMILGVAAHKLVGKHVNRYLPKWLPVNF